MEWPDPFVRRMEAQFRESGTPDAFRAFLDSLDAPPSRAIRANPLKVDPAADFLTLLLRMAADQSLAADPASFPRVPWSPDGFFLPPGLMPGRHPLQATGIFYIQEPSAMLPAAVLDPQPGERILDLCAAPGGKTGRIAAAMANRGLLVANDLHADRVRALVRNLELLGVSNTVVLNESPDRIARFLPDRFDRVLVDAPCSGEGMFRRDPDAVRSWKAYGPAACVPLQRGILDAAWSALRPGGVLVYSTCTFSEEENEDQVLSFLDRHPDARLDNLGAFAPGGPPDGMGPVASRRLPGTLRIWPHHRQDERRQGGDGHFCARLVRLPEGPSPRPTDPPGSGQKPQRPSPAVLGVVRARLAEVLAPSSLSSLLEERVPALSIHGDHLHGLPEDAPDLRGLRIAKHGLHLGQVRTVRNGLRFDPAHSLALALRGTDLVRRVDLASGDPAVRALLRGETLCLDTDGPGYTVLCLDGFPVAWGLADGRGLVKNLLPPGWRRER